MTRGPHRLSELESLALVVALWGISAIALVIAAKLGMPGVAIAPAGISLYITIREGVHRGMWDAKERMEGR